MKIVVEIDAAFEQLLQQEDTDKDKKITKDDRGPKRFVLNDSKTKEQFVIEGTYHLSNLLQELAELRGQGNTFGEINLDLICSSLIEL
jgi:alpha,alpha-trehalase